MKLGRSLIATLLLATLLVAAGAALAAPGDRDPSFGTNGVVDLRIGSSRDWASAVIRRPDGKLVVVGIAGDDAALARYLPDGSLDPTFGTAGRAILRLPDSVVWPSDAIAQPDGRIVVLAETRYSRDGFKVLRFNADGSLDSTFDHTAASLPAGVTFAGKPGLALQPDGGIVIGVQRSPYVGALRLLPTGAVDTSFGTAGIAFADLGAYSAAGVAVQLDARIIVAATAAAATTLPAESRITAVRFNADGSRDLGFSMPVTPAAFGQASAVTLQPDGKLVIVGCRGTYPLTNVTAWRVLTDGSPDTGFGQGSGAAEYLSNHCATAVALRGDGRIALATNRRFDDNNPTFPARSEVSTLLPNGVRDTAGTRPFQPATTNDRATSILVDPDDRIVVAGTMDGRDFALVRFTAAVAMDPSFGNAGAVITDFINGVGSFGVRMRSVNGKYVVVAPLQPPLQSVGPEPDRGGFARVLADGTLDPTFGSGGQLTRPGAPEAFAVLADERMLLTTATGFGPAPFALIRLRSDGSEDATFGSNGRVVMPGWVGVIEPMADGRFITAGRTVQMPVVGDVGGGELWVSRRLADGSPDPSFGIDGVVRYPHPREHLLGPEAVVVQPDGKVLIGDRPFWALRLNANGSVDATFGVNGIVDMSNTGNTGYFIGLEALMLHADGRVTLAGQARGPDPLCNLNGARAAFGRVNASGLPGPEVTGRGYLAAQLQPGLHPEIEYARLDSSDRVVATGTRRPACALSQAFSTTQVALAMRFTPSGALDTQFGVGGVARLVTRPDWYGEVGEPVIDPSGRIVVPVRTLTGNSGRVQLFALQGGGDSSPNGPPADVDNDGAPNDAEMAEGRDPLVRDNDVFNSARLFVMQQYRDFLGREGDANGITSWATFMTGGENRATVADSFLRSAEFEGTGAPMTRLYFAYFLRIPDYDGLNFWISQFRADNSLETISNAFAGSPEFANTYGALDNAGFVDRVYRNVLGRAPDATGLAFWAGRLDTGMTRGQMMVQFSESAEYRALIANEVYATMVYSGMLRRAPDADGFSFWVSYLDAGNSGIAMINGIVAGAEYRSRFLP